MEQLKTRIVPLLLGVILALAAVVIIGIGAAVPVPTDLLKSLVQSLGMFAFTLVDLVTIAIPLAAAFLLLAFVSRFVNKKPDITFYALLLAPLLLMQLFYLFQPFGTAALITILPRIGLLALCLYCLARSTPKTVS